jgi:molecular chaperone GrpE
MEEKKIKNKDKKINEKIKILEEEKNNLNDKLLRVTAEMQNMKRRYDEEISRIYKYEGEELIKKLLGIVDNFERAIGLDDEILDDELSKFLSGFKLIYAELKKTLMDMGVSEIECLNKAFDPSVMDAVMTEHVNGIDPNIVIDVMLKGYKYNEKVIRPAMVKVSE